jgi:hypothetical protein
MGPERPEQPNRPKQSVSGRSNMSRRFWVQLVLGAVFFVLFATTISVPDWIEELFGVDPDRGNGALEWIIVAALGVAAACAFGLAGVEWRRTARARVLIGTN